MTPDPARPIGALHRRLAARAIDAVTVFFVLFALVVVRIFWFMDDLSDRIDPEPWGRAFVATVTYTVMYAIYDVVFTHMRGQTPGKDALNLRVVTRGTDSPPSLVRTVVRWALPGLLVLITPLWMAVVAVVVTGVTAVGPGRSAIHDLLAGTTVVHYDADLEEGEIEKVDRNEVRRKYGARNILDLLNQRIERNRYDDDDR